MLMSEFTQEEFAAYLAGFIDGEGCVWISKSFGHVELNLANTHLPVLEEFRERIGFGSIAWQQQKAHYKKRYVLTFKNLESVRHVLEIARPFMHIKAGKADQAIAIAKDHDRLARIIDERNDAVRLAVAGGEMQKHVANRFRISQQSVSAILHGDKWASCKEQFKQRSGHSNFGTAKVGFERSQESLCVSSDPFRVDFNFISKQCFAAYLAAFFDGEGWVGFHGKSLGMSITNTDEAIIKAIRSKLGFGGIMLERHSNGDKDTHRIHLTNSRDCLELLNLMIPYLRIKLDKSLDAVVEASSVLKQYEYQDSRNSIMRQLAAEGMFAHDIASRLNVCEATVRRVIGKNHRWPSKMKILAALRKKDHRGRFLQKDQKSPDES